MACMPNCEETCSDVISSDPCSSEEKVEGCFCPADKVVVNGECVERSNCTNCVDETGLIFEVMVIYGEFEQGLLCRRPWLKSIYDT